MSTWSCAVLKKKNHSFYFQIFEDIDLLGEEIDNINLVSKTKLEFMVIEEMVESE